MDKIVIVNDLMQINFKYHLTEPIGKNFDKDFNPEFTPKKMLELGVFGGKYMTDCQNEFPKSWYKNAKLCHEKHDPKLNYFKVLSGQSLKIWRENGWIRDQDPRGWFQWYCRYYMGRRSPDDERQIKRWIAFKRHLTQLKKNCKKGDMACRPVQRQALLQWAYDSRNI